MLRTPLTLLAALALLTTACGRAGEATSEVQAAPTGPPAGYLSAEHQMADRALHQDGLIQDPEIFDSLQATETRIDAAYRDSTTAHGDQVRHDETQRFAAWLAAWSAQHPARADSLRAAARNTTTPARAATDTTPATGRP